MFITYVCMYVCMYVIDEFMYRSLQYRTLESHNNICAYVRMYVLYVYNIYMYMYMLLAIDASGFTLSNICVFAISYV